MHLKTLFSSFVVILISADKNVLYRALLDGHCELVQEIISDPRLDPTLDDNQAIFLATSGPAISTGCLQSLLSSKWVQPSAYSNVAIKYLLGDDQNAKELQDEMISMLVSDGRFDPVGLSVNFDVNGNEGLKVLPELLPENKAADELVKLCKESEGLENLAKIDLKGLDATTVSMMLLAAAANGQLPTVEYLLQNASAGPAYLNFIALRFAAAYGHFEISEAIARFSGLSDGELAQMIQRVYENSYVECWRSMPDSGMSERTFSLLRWILTEYQMAVAPACHRVKTHFRYQFSKEGSSVFDYLTSRIALMEKYIGEKGAGMPEGANYLLQYYATPLPGLYRLISKLFQGDGNKLRAAMKNLQGKLSKIAKPLDKKEYPIADPAQAVERLFSNKYDRLLTSGKSTDAYAKAREAKGRYFQQRASNAAASNQTRESYTPVIRKRPDGLPEVSGLQNTFNNSAPYWAEKDKELLDRFGAWFVSFEQDFERFALGTEILSVPIQKITSVKINKKKKAAQQAAFLKSHPDHIYSYHSVDWKQIHGFDHISENGDTCTVTIIDMFPRGLIPISLERAVDQKIFYDDERRNIDEHGVAVMSLMVHPELGVSSEIRLNLMDVSTLLLWNFVHPDLGADIQALAELVKNHRIETNLELVGDIVNASFGPLSHKSWTPTYDLRDQSLFLQMYTMIKSTGCIMVTTSGNSGSKMEIGHLGTKLMARDPDTSPLVIVALSLLDDGLHVAPFTDQPGDDKYMQKCSLSVIGSNLNILKAGKEDEPGTNSGTSFSAPIISGAAALLLSHIRKTTTQAKSPRRIVVKALLESAEPIILVRTTLEERIRLRAMLEDETPVALKGVLARDLVPGAYSITVAGESRTVDVSQGMIDESRRRYGMGRMRLDAAFQLVDELTLVPKPELTMKNRTSSG